MGDAPRTSTRDAEELRRQLEAWVATKLPAAADATVPPIDSPVANGWSSETLLFDVEWMEDGERASERLVARVAPDPSAMPVFPHYDMPGQARVMSAVGSLTTVPVPSVRWVEPDASVLGEPFFVMERVEGDVPPDIPPYDMAGWVVEATPEQRARLEQGSVGVLAGLWPTSERLDRLGFVQYDWPGDTALRRHLANERHYWTWTADGRRSELVDRPFAWLDGHWPAHEGPSLLSWGDARIGNLMYRDFEPVAVLDWEMAAIAPPEVDVAWMIYMHAYFESIARRYELPGLPDLLRADEVCSAYEVETGYAPRDMGFFVVYSALRHLLITLRINLRRMHFGELVHTRDLDATIDHVELLDDLMSRSPGL
jgi:aminoglycoside phosphotransferase (APT) family kinase protein